MATFCSHLLFFCLLQDLCWSIKVHLKGPQYVRKNDSVLLNCSTDSRPIGGAAELLVNNQTYTDIRYSKNFCFSAALKKKCTPALCNCSTKGLWFTHKYQILNDDAFVQFTCIMKYRAIGSYSDSLNVTIVDITDPVISTDSSFPLYAGTVVKFECEVKSLLLITSVDWICFKTQKSVKIVREKGRLISTLTMTVLLSDHGRSCSCVTSVYGFITHSSVQLQVINEPKKTDRVTCFNSTSVTLSCDTGDKGSFSSWTHSVNGTFIRTLQGFKRDNASKLTIGTCRPQDTGNYTCIQSSNHSNDKLKSHIKLLLVVNGPPYIADTSISRLKRLIISVAFYSRSDKMNDSVWLLNDNPIRNSTSYIQTTVKAQIQTEVYGKMINTEGYITKLYANIKTFGTFIVVLQNNFGTTKKSFTIDKSTIDLSIFVFTITAVGIFILTMTCSTIATRVRKFTQVIHFIDPNDRPSSRAVSVYHSAQQFRLTPNLYDSTDPQYLEVIDYESPLHHSDTDLKVISSGDIASIKRNSNSSGYEDVDI